MNKIFKVFAALLAIMVGIRVSGMLLLFADRSSDVDVLLAIAGMLALILGETLVFRFLFSQRRKA